MDIYVQRSRFTLILMTLPLAESIVRIWTLIKIVLQSKLSHRYGISMKLDTRAGKGGSI